MKVSKKTLLIIVILFFNNHIYSYINHTFNIQLETGQTITAFSAQCQDGTKLSCTPDQINALNNAIKNKNSLNILTSNDGPSEYQVFFMNADNVEWGIIKSPIVIISYTLSLGSPQIILILNPKTDSTQITFQVPVVSEITINLVGYLNEIKLDSLSINGEDGSSALVNIKTYNNIILNQIEADEKAHMLASWSSLVEDGNYIVHITTTNPDSMDYSDKTVISSPISSISYTINKNTQTIPVADSGILNVRRTTTNYKK